MTTHTTTDAQKSSIVAFAFEGHEVRGFEYAGEPHFIGNEVSDALGYTNASKALGDHCKALKKINYNESLEMGLTARGKNLRGFSVIPERDVYRLIMRSNLPTAEAFEEKVVGEILPAIRKTGGYMHAALDETPEELALRAMNVLQETVKRQKAQLDEALPKAAALDRISFAEGEFGQHEVAKMIQVKPIVFTKFLDTNRWRYARGKVKLAYQDRIDAGYMRNKAHPYTDNNGEEHLGNTIRITTKGLLKFAQIVPGAKLDPVVEESMRPFAKKRETEPA
ncbi:phage antirepressor KilAC domain-containing protein [Komagataeibacter oboediens]|uniref:phage antirepressor KilAC domain-containing protein n=1 Tax=Komagataeibacter oboediens TaxID=65958 RepID=UPI0002FF0FE8|nr:phage antirepressor KilAC domain-containing protein [Komagataeibacter oboediens]